MANQKLDMSYTIKSGGIFPYIELGDYVLHIMTNFDQPDSEMDFSITTGRICAYNLRDFQQNVKFYFDSIQLKMLNLH